MQLDAESARIRSVVLQTFVGTGRGPTVEELAAATGWSAEIARGALARLDEAHVVVLEPGTDVIRMAMPFSGVPTPFRVTPERPAGAAASWWANCAWDALGIAAALAGADIQAARAPIHVATDCPDCDRPLTLVVRAHAASPAGAVRSGSTVAGEAAPVVHFAVAASRWWDDIGFT